MFTTSLAKIARGRECDEREVSHLSGKAGRNVVPRKKHKCTETVPEEN